MNDSFMKNLSNDSFQKNHLSTYKSKKFSAEQLLRRIYNLYIMGFFLITYNIII